MSLHEFITGNRLNRENSGESSARAGLRRGQALLEKGDPAGVKLVLQAAERDPSLLEEAARAVEAWLNGTGALGDAEPLRHELARMQVLHHAALMERMEANGAETYRTPDAAIAAAVEKELRPWRRIIRVAWLGERVCRSAPRWRHHELLLELKPSSWHFRADARERLQRLARRIEQAVAPDEGTLAVRLHPLHVPLEHVRNMRRRAFPLPLEQEEQELELQDAGTRPQNGQDADGHAEPATALRRASTSLKSGVLATLLALPLWAGWQMFSNDDTQRKLQMLEHKHALRLARHYWRREEAAGLFSPVKTVQAFLQGLRQGDLPASALLADAASRAAFQRLHRDRRRLRAIGMQWADCGQPVAAVEMDHAVVRWPEQEQRCMPFLLRREAGRWRIAWRGMRTTFATDAHGHWRLAASDGSWPRQWLFAFRGALVDLDGYVRPLQGADGKGGLVLPVALPPHGENTPPLRGHRLEPRNSAGHMRKSE